jgi:hypothetical protein
MNLFIKILTLQSSDHFPDDQWMGDRQQGFGTGCTGTGMNGLPVRDEMHRVHLFIVPEYAM